LLRKLKFREVLNAKTIIGTLKQSNRNILVDSNNFYSPSHPYFEAGIAIENILKIIRIDGIWRLNYLDNPDASRFAIMGSLQLTF
ncbi:MAG TPA: carboxypeptidase-like regulatory domain-containing protein, partial [Bacteroidia bacterium]|nr:carboxypeptidase-like regulatory domain-containing protein [Bacteroidia bacterium]